MALLRPRVRDDRGRRVGVDERVPVSGRSYLWSALLLIPWTACFVAVLKLGAANDSTPLTDALVVGVICSAYFVVLPILRDRGPNLRPMQLCGACRYPLHGLVAEADGCTVCPECGAAWRMEGTEGQRDAGTEGKGE